MTKQSGSDSDQGVDQKLDSLISRLQLLGGEGKRPQQGQQPSSSDATAGSPPAGEPQGVPDSAAVTGTGSGKGQPKPRQASARSSSQVKLPRLLRDSTDLVGRSGNGPGASSRGFQTECRRALASEGAG